MDIFKILLLIARPAAGKSEIIHFLKATPLEERVKRFHVGELNFIDDFPMLWTWFEEDRILEEMGKPRLHTDNQEYFLYPYFWNVLIRRIGLKYDNILRDDPTIHDSHTTLVEFARGKEHGGFAEAFRHIPRKMAENMAVCYVNVSWEESKRKDSLRYNPDKPDSLLEHGLNEKMEKLYKESDWDEVSAADPDCLSIAGVNVPYVVFENEDDVTTRGGEVLGERLEETLSRLWKLTKE